MKFVSKEPVTKGFSSDKKYRVMDENGVFYLLREADLTQKARKEEEFRIMQQLETMGLSMCRPVKLWWDEAAIYSLHSWIEGEDLEAVLSRLSEAEQYRLGLEAGQQLRIIHSMPAPANCGPWTQLYSKKLERTERSYAACPRKLPCEDFFLNIIGHGQERLSQRPVRLQHGDFHRGNLMLERHGHVTVIDFQKFGWGDPWEEFDSITWDVQLAPVFARGRVDGYFEGPPPADFWQLFQIYVCRGILSGWGWAKSRSEAQSSIMAEHAAMVRGWYNDGSPVPGWHHFLREKEGPDEPR